MSDPLRVCRTARRQRLTPGDPVPAVPGSCKARHTAETRLGEAHYDWFQSLSKRHAKARQRRRHTAAARLQRDCRQAQYAAKVLEQAVDDLALPENLVAEIEGRLRSQHKFLGKIVGIMFPPLFGCRTNSELCRVRGWDKNLPTRLLGALSKRSWLKRLRRLGMEVLVPLWRHTARASAATRSRWQWTWVGDDLVFKKYGEQLGLAS